MQSSGLSPRGRYKVKPDPRFKQALELMEDGYTRHGAAVAVGMNAKTLWNRVERFRIERGLKPIPDGRRKPVSA